MNNSPENQNNFDMELEIDDFSSLDDFLRDFEEREGLSIDDENVVIEIEDCNEFEYQNVIEILPEPEPPRTKPAAEEQEKLKANLARLEQEKKESFMTFQRRYNDFENYRKRTEKERLGVFHRALGELAGKMLPVVDNLNRALDSAGRTEIEHSPEFQNFLDGVGLVNQQLLEILMEMGIQPIPSVGQQFDPHVHEAVATEQTSEVPHNTVIAELLKGYQIGEKVLRPALVKVAISSN